MLTELMFIALVVCLLFCESAKEKFAHAMSIGALLESVVIEYAVNRSVLPSENHRRVPKVRARVVQLSLRWRLTGFKTAL